MATFKHGAHTTGTMDLSGRLTSSAHPANVGLTNNTFMAKGHWTADSESGKLITVDPGFTPDEWWITIINHGGVAGTNNVTVNYRFVYEDGTTMITSSTVTVVDGGGATAHVTLADVFVPQLQVMVTKVSGDTIHDDGVTILVKARQSAFQLSEQSAAGDYSANTLTPVTP